MPLVVFLITALIMVVFSCIVTFSRNLVYSAFSLLGMLLGSAILFGLLSSDFVAVTQLLVYVGGILILILFAVMLTSNIESAKVTNLSVNWQLAAPTIFLLFVGMASLLVSARWPVVESPKYQSMVEPIGNALLQEYLLPFEVISVLLLAALVGAVVLVRREVR